MLLCGRLENLWFKLQSGSPFYRQIHVGSFDRFSRILKWIHMLYFTRLHVLNCMKCLKYSTRTHVISTIYLTSRVLIFACNIFMSENCHIFLSRIVTFYFIFHAFVKAYFKYWGIQISGQLGMFAINLGTLLFGR